MVLPEPASLGPLVPEHGAEVVQSHGLGKDVHPVLKIRAANRGRSLGPQGYQVPTPVLEGVHLLLHDVRALSHRPDEQPRVLEDGGIEAGEPVPLADGHGAGLHIAPVLLLLRQQVGGSPGGLEHHGYSPSRIRVRPWSTPVDELRPRTSLIAIDLASLEVYYKPC